jgi:nucleotide-binding universal stress UspA family protein
MVPIRQILVPTDFSDTAAAALRWARTLAQEFDAHMHLLHVVAEPYLYPWGSELSAFPLNDVLAQSEEAARAQLGTLAGSLDLPVARVTTATALGTPVDRILEYAKEQGVDLIVMGTHGRGVVGHLLLGSVAERVVRRSTVPVLTIRQ